MICAAVFLSTYERLRGSSSIIARPVHICRTNTIKQATIIKPPANPARIRMTAILELSATMEESERLVELVAFFRGGGEVGSGGGSGGMAGEGGL